MRDVITFKFPFFKMQKKLFFVKDGDNEGGGKGN